MIIERSPEEGRRRRGVLESPLILKEMLQPGDRFGVQHDATRGIIKLHGIRVAARGEGCTLQFKPHAKCQEVDARLAAALSQARM